MAQYEFRCQTCKYEFVVEMKMKDYDTSKDMFCPECEQKSNRVFGVSPIIYKANGFYSTDYGLKRKPQPDDHMPKK